MSPVHLDIASPAVTNTIHEAANDGGRPWKSLHVQGSKEDGLCLSSRESNGGSGIGILCLRDLIFRTSLRKPAPLPPLKNPILVWATTTRKAVMPAQEVTLREYTLWLDWATQALMPNWVTILFWLCSTAISWPLSGKTVVAPWPTLPAHQHPQPHTGSTWGHPRGWG